MGGNPQPLPVYDRRAGKRFDEFLDDHPATYDTEPHKSLTQWLESQPLVDWLFAAYQDTARSAKEIEPFIQKHGIDMSEFKPVIYRSFAEFFDREFRPGVRPFPQESGAMGAFAEARYFGWETLDPAQTFPVKGRSLDAVQLLGTAERAAPFEGGPVILARLSPVDYHHVHYFDDGETGETDRLGSRLWTVNWRALLNQDDILFRNERAIHILHTRHFGRVAMVEIGAMSVGRIAQVHDIEKPFARGDEKAKFMFGGSAVALFGEPGRWRPAHDILAHTQEGVETLVRLGDVIAHAQGQSG